MVLPIAFTISCAVALVVVLVSEARDEMRWRRVFKVLASASFIAVAATGDPLGTNYHMLVIAGLVLGAVGDVALLGVSRTSFLFGLAAFLFGHLAYVAAAREVAPLASWLSPGALGALAAAVVVLVYLWPHLESMKVPVVFYVAAITLMVVGAFAVLRQGEVVRLPARATQLMFAGALLFFASDISVARQRFVRRSFYNRLWGLPAYYAGQLLFAWSTIVS